MVITIIISANLLSKFLQLTAQSADLLSQKHGVAERSALHEDSLGMKYRRHKTLTSYQTWHDGIVSLTLLPRRFDTNIWLDSVPGLLVIVINGSDCSTNQLHKTAKYIHILMICLHKCIYLVVLYIKEILQSATKCTAASKTLAFDFRIKTQPY